MDIVVHLQERPDEPVKLHKKRRTSLAELLEAARAAFKLPKSAKLWFQDELGIIEDIGDVDMDKELTVVSKIMSGDHTPPLDAVEDEDDRSVLYQEVADDGLSDEEPKKRKKRKRSASAITKPVAKSSQKTPEKKKAPKKASSAVSTRHKSRVRDEEFVLEDNDVEDDAMEVDDDDDDFDSDNKKKPAGKKKHRRKSTSSKRRPTNMRQARLEFEKGGEGLRFDVDSDSEAYPDEPEEGIQQVDDDGFKFIGCFATAIHARGRKPLNTGKRTDNEDNEWMEVRWKAGTKITFEAKPTEIDGVRPGDKQKETKIQENVTAWNKKRVNSKPTFVGRLLAPVNKRLYTLMNNQAVKISGEVLFDQVVDKSAKPLVTKILVWMNPDIYKLVWNEEDDSGNDFNTRVMTNNAVDLVSDIIRFERKLEPWWEHPFAKDGDDMIVGEDDDYEDDHDNARETQEDLPDDGPVDAGGGVQDHRPETESYLAGTYDDTIAQCSSVKEEQRRHVWIKSHMARRFKVRDLETDQEILKESITQSAALSMMHLQQVVASANVNSTLTQEEVLEACQSGAASQLLDGIYKSSRFDKLEQTSPSSNMVTEMLPFQKQGLTWLKWRETKQQTGSHQLNPFWLSFKSAESVHPLYVSRRTSAMSFKFMPADPPPLGGILADEMGMGKTIQILGLVDLIHEDLKKQPRDEYTSATLIVCTASVLDHWQSEISKHFKAGTFSVCRYHGNNKPSDPRILAKNKLVLTTYDTLSREYADQESGKMTEDDERWTSPLLEVKWRRVILDEAHGVRDLTTKKSAAVFALESERRWCITGTPVQNSLQDLYCLIKFLRVPIFTELKWWNDLVTIPFMQKDNSALTRLFDIIQPIMMRRLKTQKSSIDGQELMKLPELRKEVELLEMSEEETKFYDYLFKESKSEFERMCHLGVAMRNYRKIIELINKVRQACCHPHLAIRSIYQKGLDAQLFYDALHTEEMNISYMKSTAEQIKQIQKLKCPGCRTEMYELQELECGHNLCSPCCRSLQIWNDEEIIFNPKKQKDANSVVVCRECRAASAWPKIVKMDRSVNPPCPTQDYLDSSKTKAVITDMKSHKEKAVVFSQFTKFLDILQAGMDRENIPHLRIDGSMTPGKRNKVIEDFRAGPARVLFVSIKSGNAGIDLQVASRAYIMEPWWNPGVEEQAMHRVHRMGQTKEVIVKRYFIKGSVEERMLKLQEGKLYLSKFADQDKESLTKNYKLEELKALFDDARLDMKGEIARRNGQTGERSWLETAHEEIERENDFNRRSLGAGVIRKRKGTVYDETNTFDPFVKEADDHTSDYPQFKPDPHESGGSGDDSSAESPSKRPKFW